MTDKKGKGKAKTRSHKRKRHYKNPYDIEPFSTWKWKKYDSNESMDIGKFIEDYKDCLFFIGTDSQSYSKSGSCVFTSVLIAYRLGEGGRIIRHTDRRSIVPKEALSAKLTVETQRSIEICKFVEEKLLNLSDNDHDYTKNLIGVSIDVNSDELKGKSGRYKDMLVGMVMSYGWKAFVKPDSWAASHVADAKC